MTFSLIAAIAHDGALGQGGGLPWGTLDQDMQWFWHITTSLNPLRRAQDLIAIHEDHGRGMQWDTSPYNALIMGRRTYESLPGPLAGREMIVLTSQAPPLYESYDEEQERWHVASFVGAVEVAEKICFAPNAFVIGGARVFQEALQHPGLERMYITEIDAGYPEADTRFPCCDLRGEHNVFEVGKWILWPEPLSPPSWEIPDDRYDRWHRTAVSTWITEPEETRYRFGIWERI